MSDTHILSTWYEAYGIIAKLLQKAYEDNKDHPSAYVYSRLINKKFALLNGDGLFNTSSSGLVKKGLDPIQIFATFNYPNIFAKKREEIINSLFEEFNSQERIDDTTSFDDCPSPIITQIVQYRGLLIQVEIWDMFNEIMRSGMNGLTKMHFRSLKEWHGIDIASLTTFLFWINSKEFLPMDRNTIDFLKSFKIIDSRPRYYEEYMNLCLRLRAGNFEYDDVFRNIVRDSYLYSNSSYSGAIFSGSTANIISKPIELLEETAKQRRKERTRGFKIIAIRPKAKPGNEGKQERQKHIKVLTEGELYQFYHSYLFNVKSDNEITYNPDEDVELYSMDRLNISISAVVGKNGSGKSTIAEFLYLIINKIAYSKKIGTTEKLVEEEVFADLFVKLDKLYKISVGESVEVFEYKLDQSNIYHLSTEDDKAKEAFRNFDVEDFCYSIVVNYSLYALNTNITGNWIYPLFHKNDSYQVPIVLNPLREKGNIDVNSEEGLAKSRMLSNILEPNLIDFKHGNIPELVPGSVPVKLVLEFDRKKMERKILDYNNTYGKLLKDDVDVVINLLRIEENFEVKFLYEARNYIYLKIVTIADRYLKFKRNYEGLPKWISNNRERLKSYLIKLLEDTSHITFKVRQAINYLKYNIYKPGEENDILSLSNQIREIKNTPGIRTIDLVPPPFFKSNITFKYRGTFNDLSSGEKQQIFSINTITYHLYNLGSVMYEEDTFKYHNINIIFDEVELYFHPEMQRTYINNLWNSLKNLRLQDNIHNVNILFITHSPFILSDIPSSNILRLALNAETGKAVSSPNKEKTFGANIHDLLANDFFLENGFMGQFANRKIQSIINKIDSWKENQTQKNTDSLYRIIQLIGEPLVKESLMDLYRDKIGLSNSDIDAEIKRLQELKKELNDSNSI